MKFIKKVPFDDAFDLSFLVFNSRSLFSKTNFSIRIVHAISSSNAICGARACAAISLCLRVPGSTKTVSGSSTCQFNWSTITIEFDHKK